MSAYPKIKGPVRLPSRVLINLVLRKYAEIGHAWQTAGHNNPRSSIDGRKKLPAELCVGKSSSPKRGNGALVVHELD